MAGQALTTLPALFSHPFMRNALANSGGGARDHHVGSLRLVRGELPLCLVVDWRGSGLSTATNWLWAVGTSSGPRFPMGAVGEGPGEP